MIHNVYFVTGQLMIFAGKCKINYEDFIIKLNIHGCSCFEQYTAAHLIEDYVTKYNTKGGLNSDN